VTRDQLLRANKNCRTSIQEGHCHAMYGIFKTRNMDRFCNNGRLTYPMNAQPPLRRNKPQTQFYTNGSSAAANQQAPFPCYVQTPCPEQVPLDWNMPFLPEHSSSYSAPQSFVQDLNSAQPSYTSRAYQNGLRTVPGAESFYCKNNSGGFLTLNCSLTN